MEQNSLLVTGALLGGLLGVLLGMFITLHRGYIFRSTRLFGRRLRILPKKTVSVGRKSAAGGIGVGGGSSSIMRELLTVDYAALSDAIESEGERFDFAKFRRNLVRKSGGYRTFKIPSGPLYASEGHAQRDVELVEEFFSSRVQIATDADNLFDEEEGLVTARLLKTSDGPVLYAIDRFREMVGDNARRIAVIAAFVVCLPAAIAWMLAHTDFLAAVGDTQTAWVSVGGTLGAAVLYLVFQKTYYGKARDTSFGAFSSFLQSYFAGVSDQFLSAHSRMSNAIAGETDEQMLEGNAISSHRSMIWLSFRIFLVEGFLRNEYYQMRRNLRFYELTYILIVAVVVVGVAMSLISAGTPFSANAPLTAVAPWGFLGLTILASLFVWFNSVGKSETESEISNLSWRGFKELKVGDNMRQVIGSYAREAAIGKNRFGRTRG